MASMPTPKTTLLATQNTHRRTTEPPLPHLSLRGGRATVPHIHRARAAADRSIANYTDSSFDFDFSSDTDDDDFNDPQTGRTQFEIWEAEQAAARRRRRATLRMQARARARARERRREEDEAFREALGVGREVPDLEAEIWGEREGWVGGGGGGDVLSTMGSESEEVERLGMSDRDFGSVAGGESEREHESVESEDSNVLGVEEGDGDGDGEIRGGDGVYEWDIAYAVFAHDMEMYYSSAVRLHDPPEGAFDEDEDDEDELEATFSADDETGLSDRETYRPGMRGGAVSLYGYTEDDDDDDVRSERSWISEGDIIDHHDLDGEMTIDVAEGKEDILEDADTTMADEHSSLSDPTPDFPREQRDHLTRCETTASSETRQERKERLFLERVRARISPWNLERWKPRVEMDTMLTVIEDSTVVITVGICVAHEIAMMLWIRNGVLVWWHEGR